MLPHCPALYCLHSVFICYDDSGQIYDDDDDDDDDDDID